MEAARSILEDPVESGQNAGELSTKPGGFWRRSIAFLADILILQIVIFPIEAIAANVILTDAATEGSIVRVLVTLFELAIFAVYAGWFLDKKGATPGKMLLSLKVVDARHGLTPTFANGMLRFFPGVLLSIVLGGYGIFMIAFRKDKRGLHDLMFNTRVIKSSNQSE